MNFTKSESWLHRTSNFSGAGYSEDLITHHAYILARTMLAASKGKK